MSANVETMMYVRETPWHGLGTRVEEALTSADAIKYAGLDWTVNSMPVYDSFQREIPNYVANVRSSDNSVLGIVSNRYKIVQNQEAFEFTDNLISEGVVYETAGSLNGGKRIWLLAKMPEQKILGDKFDPYLCFVNSHDGTGAIKVCCTPIRVVCNNTLNLALERASRTWSTRHMGDMASKLAEAKHTLGMASEYMNELNNQAELLADSKISSAEVEKIVTEVFPIDYNKDSNCKIKNAERMRDEFFRCYNMPDIAQFKNTKWGVINAVTDLVAHTEPARQTTNYRENNWGKIMNGHTIVDTVFNKIYA